MRIKEIIIVLLILTGCITEFDPPSIGYENLLVVEAFLSNDDQPFQVTLSRTTSIDTTAFIPETGAGIELINDQGESFGLYEDKPGEYQSFEVINPSISTGYKLSIRTSNGNQYESNIVIMRETPEIDSVTYKYKEIPETDLKGIQVYVTTHDPENKTWYYRWEWDETWVFYTPYNSTNIYKDGEILLRQDNINKCWKHSGSTEIKIFSSKSLTEDVISNYPLLFVSNQTDRLYNKYTVNVKQYCLSEESYNYWLELEKVTESLGTLFDPQPTTVYSNIHNTNNEDEVVLGYFDASSVKQERVFVTRSQLPYIKLPNYYQYCEDSIVPLGLVPEMILRGYMLAYETQNEFGAFVYVMSSPTCIDCRLAGTNVEPDFWE